jgi:hypothetical protein
LGLVAITYLLLNNVMSCGQAPQALAANGQSLIEGGYLDFHHHDLFRTMATIAYQMQSSLVGYRLKVWK